MHSKFFNIFLLCGHLGFLLAFLFFKWTGMDSSNQNCVMRFFEDVRALPIERLLVEDVYEDFRDLNQYKSLLIIFTCNFIGMAFSRGYHQQFYSWYNYSLPFLVDAAFGPGAGLDPDNACSHHSNPLTKFAIILSLEIAWSVAKPRNPLQSYTVCICHALIAYGLLFWMGKLPSYRKKNVVKKVESSAKKDDSSSKEAKTK